MKGVALVLLVAAVTGMVSSAEESSWYAPSRKAALYAHKYRGLREQLTRIEARQDNGIRLPRDVLPTEYYIRLLPFIEVNNFTTDGYVEIIVDCQSATSNISINAAELTIKLGDVSVNDAITNQNFPVDMIVDEQNDREIITLVLKSTLLVGRKYKITIKFISYLNTDLRGFYRSSYEENGVTKYLAISQMEAPDARRAFPCFDEPNMKANFTITLGRKESMSAISNMPLARSESIQGMMGYVWDHYQPSVKMSTYLVAMMVSEFIKVTSPSELSPGVVFNIWSRPSFIGQTNYSANIGPRILKAYVDDYFKIDFPLPKVDMAAVPDFAAGAMENWGLITYREADLLFDPVRSSAVAKQRVAIIIAHELAHQWFGNLVTMDWWNVIWLNEGFASYLEYPGTHYVEPGFEMNEQFTVTDLHYVFGIDALESSRPIDLEVNTPSEINQMFDAISYEKGSCVIRMCADFLSEPVFRRGVTRYLNQNAYGNTVQDDLWSALQQQADEESVYLPASIKKIMTTWTKQMGYPVINVTRSYDWMNSAYVTQQRFLLRKSPNSNDQNVYRWWVPLTYTSNFSHPTIGRHWYPSDQGDNSILILEGATTNRWVIFNVGQEGYYRVVYDQRNIEMIRQQLMTEHSAISKKNRAQIMDDYLNLARANVTSYVTALELTRYLKHERDYAPWTAASVALDFVDIMLYSMPDEKDWKDYMTSLVADLYSFVGYTDSVNDFHLKIYTRSQALSWACSKLNMVDCIDKSKVDYKLWMDTGKELSPNNRRLVACTAIAKGNRTHWQFGFDKYVASTLANEKIDLLRAITCSEDVAIINEMLTMMITPDSGIRLQDAGTLFSNIAANPIGHQVALDFMTYRWSEIETYYGNYQGFGGGGIPGLFRALCNRVNSERKLTQLTKLRDDHMDVFGNSKTVSQGLELAQANVDWVNKHYSTIVTWLKRQQPSTPATTVRPMTTTSKSSANTLHAIPLLSFAYLTILMSF